MNNQNQKWIKVSAPLTTTPSSTLGSTGINWRDVASKIFRVKETRDMFAQRFPAFSGGIGPQLFVENFMKALADKSFQVLAFSAAQKLLGLGLLSEEQYKPEAFEQLFRTKGYGGESIAAGAYQKTTGKLPPREILPKMTIDQFEAELRKIGNDPNLKPAEKMKKLSEFLKTVESNMSSFSQFINTNLPFVRSLTGQ